MSDFLLFCQAAESIGAVSSRLEKARLLGEYFAALSDAGLRRAALYFGGHLFPLREGRVVSVGGAALFGALRKVSGAEDNWLRERLVARGDLGDVAREAFEFWPAAPSQSEVSLEEIERQIALLASTPGSKAKSALLEAFLGRLSGLEAQYFLKMLLGDLRIGLKEGAVEDAIARLAGQSVALVQRANMLTGDLGAVALLARHNQLETAKFALFHPLKFMLATPAADLGDVARQMPESFVVEDKFDGIRAQVHIAPHRQNDEILHGVVVSRGKSSVGTAEINDETSNSGNERSNFDNEMTNLENEVFNLDNESVKTINETTKTVTEVAKISAEATNSGIEASKSAEGRAEMGSGDEKSAAMVRVALFSRTLDEITGAFPDLHGALAALLPPDSAGIVLDGEIVPVRGDQIAPFQELQKRLGRKIPTSAILEAVPVAFVAYDALFAGEILLERSFEERRTALETLHFDEMVARLAVSKQFSDVAALDEEFDAARSRGNEGLMIKDPRAIYKPGRRGREWLKIKRAIATLDVVVTSVESGSGRRAKFYSDYTFAVRASESDDTLLNVGKAYSGLTDAEIARLSEWFVAHTTQVFAHGRVRVVEPQIVLEITFDAVQSSPRHKSGYALRFPRILRIRDDKPAREIDTLETVARLSNF